MKEEKINGVSYGKRYQTSFLTEITDTNMKSVFFGETTNLNMVNAYLSLEVKDMLSYSQFEKLFMLSLVKHIISDYKIENITREEIIQLLNIDFYSTFNVVYPNMLKNLEYYKANDFKFEKRLNKFKL